MSDGLRLWAVTRHDHLTDDVEVSFGPRQDPGTLLALVPAWIAEHMVRQHNAEVEAARAVSAARPTVGDLEGFARRVLVAALRELIRDALPGRRRGKRVYTGRG